MPRVRTPIDLLKELRREIESSNPSPALFLDQKRRIWQFATTGNLKGVATRVSENLIATLGSASSQALGSRAT